MGEENLQDAKEAKQDEFYTQFKDIENEINAYLDRNDDVFRGKVLLLPCDDPDWSSFTRYFAKNFKRLGLKKLISTSYAPNSKPKEIPYQPALFELESPLFDEEKTYSRGKIFTLTGDTTSNLSQFTGIPYSFALNLGREKSKRPWGLTERRLLSV